MAKTCLTCPATLAARNTSGRCLSCACKWAIATRPGMLEARRKAGHASANRPGERERRSEAAKQQNLYRIGHAARTPETFKLMGVAISNARMAWCPPHLRDEARRLTTSKRLHLSEVKEIILAQHDAEMVRFRRRMAA